MELVDDALHSAAEAGTKTSKEADEKFRMTIETLSDYEMDYHARRLTSDGDDSDTVHRRMEVANAKDKSSSTILNRLKESLKVREGPRTFASSDTNFQPLEAEPTTTVEFLLHKSLPDKSPTIVKRKQGFCRVKLVTSDSYNTRGAQEKRDSGGNSVELQPFQGSEETSDPLAEPALLRMAPFVAGGIWRCLCTGGQISSEMIRGRSHSSMYCCGDHMVSPKSAEITGYPKGNSAADVPVGVCLAAPG